MSDVCHVKERRLIVHPFESGTEINSRDAASGQCRRGSQRYEQYGSEHRERAVQGKRFEGARPKLEIRTAGMGGAVAVAGAPPHIRQQLCVDETQHPFG
jgi:hypothetical protein